MIINLKSNDIKLNNQNVYLKDKGTPGILLVHADWCGHCKHFMPQYLELSKYFGNSFRCYAIEASHLIDSISKHMKIEYFPTIKFVDQNGKIIGTFPSDEERSVQNILKHVCNVYHHCIRYH